jgi:hypothetical protein
MDGGYTKGGVRVLLRLEAFALFLAAIAAYSQFGVGWKWFAIFFLAPDLSFVFFLFGSRIGAIAYNAAHSTIGPIVVLVAAYFALAPILPSIGLIWLAHVGFDRMLGYGLKYASAFGDTHLGRIGRRKEAAAA